MQNRRYYPTVLLSQVDVGLAPHGEMLVAGGSEDWWDGPWQPPSVYHDDYEAFRPGTRAWPNYLGGVWRTTAAGSRLFPGPTAVGGGQSPRFLWYPRLFILPDGRMVNAASEPQSSRAAHPTATTSSWTQLGQRTLPGG